VSADFAGFASRLIVARMNEPAAPGPGHARSRLELLGAAALFSTGGAAIKACTLSSFQVAGFRSLVAAAALLLFVPEARRPVSPRAWAVAVAYAATLVLFVAGNKLTTAANTIFLQSTAPLYVLLLGPWLLAERVRRVDVVFLAIAAVGVALFLVEPEAAQRTAPNPFRGNLFALASGVSWALTLLGLRSFGSREAPSSGHGAVVLGNVLAFCACAPWAFPVRAMRATDALLLAYLGIVQIGLAYVLVVRGMRNARALEASILLLLEPALNPIWAWLVHGEIPSSWALAGGALVLAATGGMSVFDARKIA
jgi:DME family drug/metabolite transporter